MLVRPGSGLNFGGSESQVLREDQVQAFHTATGALIGPWLS
jgi:hypothetical protein